MSSVCVCARIYVPSNSVWQSNYHFIKSTNIHIHPTGANIEQFFKLKSSDFLRVFCGEQKTPVVGCTRCQSLYTYKHVKLFCDTVTIKFPATESLYRWVGTVFHNRRRYRCRWHGANVCLFRQNWRTWFDLTLGLNSFLSEVAHNWPNR